MLERLRLWTLTVDPAEPETHIASKIGIVLGLVVIASGIVVATKARKRLDPIVVPYPTYQEMYGSDGLPE